MIRTTSMLLCTLLAAGFATSATAQSAGPRTQLVSRGGNDWSSGCDVARGGAAVSFTSAADTLVDGDTNGSFDVLVARGRRLDVQRVSVTSREKQARLHSAGATISDDGRRVAFLADGYRMNARVRFRTAFVRDVTRGKTRRVSVTSDGRRPKAGSGAPAISGDGLLVAFASSASNLAPRGDDNEVADSFVHEPATGKTSRVSLSFRGGDPDGGSYEPVASRTGRYVAFTSKATNLVRGDDNRTGDVFRYDRKTRRTIRVSVASDGTEAPLISHTPAISGDGRFVAFSTSAELVPEDDNGGELDVYVHDAGTGTTELVSTGPGGSGQGSSWSPSLSDDGRYVAFASDADDLVEGDINGDHGVGAGGDLFVRDRAEGRTILVSVGDEGQQGTHDTEGGSISPDGGWVCWSTSSTNLVTGDRNNTTDVFLRGPLWDE